MKKKETKVKKEIKDPRQLLFLSYYMNPKSKTFSDALHSALDAGYSESYARQIVSLTGDRKQGWLQDNTRYDKMVERAEKNIIEMLEKEEFVEKRTKDGDIYYDTDGNILRTKADITKFVSERIGNFRRRDEVAVDVRGESIDKMTEVLTTLMNKKDYGDSRKDK